jgi:uncharacterized protein
MKLFVVRAREIQRRLDASTDVSARQVSTAALLELFRERTKSGNDKELVDIVRIAPSVLDGKTSDGESAAHILAFHGKSGLLSALRPNLDLNDRDKNQRTPLHLAAWAGSLEATNTLLDLGSDVALQDEYGATAMHVAVFRKQWEITRRLLVASPTLVDVQTKEGETVLHFMAKEDAPEILRSMLQATNLVNKHDAQGRTALHVCAQHANASVMRLLLEAGADPELRDKYLDTPLHYAAERGNLETIRHLLDNGANPDPKDAYGLTPLQLAAGEGHSDAVRQLALRGADVNHRDSDGESALHLAARDGHARTVGVLLALGAEASAKSADGATAEEVARDKGLKDVVKILKGQVDGVKASRVDDP